MRHSVAIAVLALSAARLFSQSSQASVQSYFEQGERALAEERYSEAEAAYEKLRKLAPNVAEVYGRLGLVYFQEKRFAEAVPVLRQALKLKPSLPNTDILLGMSLSEVGQYSEARPILDKAFHHSNDPALKRMSGLQLERTYTGLRRDADAVQTALELNRLYPKDPEVLILFKPALRQLCISFHAETRRGRTRFRLASRSRRRCLRKRRQSRHGHR